MTLFPTHSLSGIKPNALLLVKGGAWVCLLSLTLAGSTPSQAKPNASGRAVDETELPDIEARSFDVQVAKRSRSKTVYLFDDPSASAPPVGKILLLRRSGENIMALKVLKAYRQKKRFVAKRVRYYKNFASLELSDSLLAYEKLKDVVVTPPTAEDKRDLETFEDELLQDPEMIEPEPPVDPAMPVPAAHPANDPAAPVEEALPADTEAPAESTVPEEPGPAADDPDLKEVAYDPELDAESSPPPSGAADSSAENEELEGVGDSSIAMGVEDITPLEPNTYSLTGSFGSVRNSQGFFQGGGVRFAYTFKRMWLVAKPQLQDTLSLDTGIFLYKTLFSETAAGVQFSAAYNVMPVLLTLRYNLLVGENLSAFVYGGLMVNQLVFAATASAERFRNLQTMLPAGGVGLMFRMGPSWDLRFDAGYDVVAMGIMLGF